VKEMSVTSFRRGGPNLMSDDISGTTSKTEPKTDWRRLRSMNDEEVHAAIIDDPDAKPTDEAFWKEARVVMPRRKETVTMRLDARSSRMVPQRTRLPDADQCHPSCIYERSRE
jgi:hypothetical protein